MKHHVVRAAHDDDLERNVDRPHSSGIPGRGGTIHSSDDSELDARSCPKEKLDPDEDGELDDGGEPSGIPPGELLALDGGLELGLHGIPMPGLVSELDADEDPEVFDPCGGELSGAASGSRPGAPGEFTARLDPRGGELPALGARIETKGTWVAGVLSAGRW